MSSWLALLKFTLIGADRTDAASLEAIRARAGLAPAPEGHEPARRVLETLSAVRLLRRAAAPLLEAPSDSLAPASADDTRPLCAPAAVRDLRAMLRGTYAEALGEFFGLLHARGQRLPPECLPEVLDRAAAQAERAPGGAPAAFPGVDVLGPTAHWLAGQNPAWHGLLPDAEPADWHLSAHPARLALLRATRRTDPAHAIAWLESTWTEETAEHRAAFLAELATGLSVADEPLLERAWAADRGRSVRLVAFGLLQHLPGSAAARAAQQFFAEGLAAALDPTKRDDVLTRVLPDPAEPAVQPYVSLLAGAAKGHWRQEVFYLLLRHLPPHLLLNGTWKTPAKLLRRLADDRREPDALGAVLEAVAGHRDQSWLPDALESCCARADHPVWQTPGPRALLAAFPVEAAGYAFKGGLVSTVLLPRFAEALRPLATAWPRELLWQFIGAVESTWGGMFYDWNNPPHWLLTVRTAAYHCRLDDAEALHARFHENFAPRPGPLQLFYDIVRFRRRLQQHFI